MTNFVAVDAMGGDNAPFEIVKGAVEVTLKNDIGVYIVGDETAINEELSKYTFDADKVIAVHASEVIKATDTPTDAIRNKKDSSMVVGLNLVKEGKASAFVSAGNTGAIMVGATLIVGRIKGIERPAIGTLLPHKNGCTLLIDSGANADCKPKYLAQFALMGSIYMENIVGIANPRVGLINVGAEGSKGSELYKESFGLLKNTGLNFIGNVEGTEIAAGAADVLVCDGFTGNVILKHTEGMAVALMGMIMREITSTPESAAAASVLKGDFSRVKNAFDASEYGGAPLLGLRGLVVKAHGSADHLAIQNAVLKCAAFVENDVVGKIADKV